MKRHWLAAIVSVAMAASLLGGCSSPQGNSGGASASQEAGSAPEAGPAAGDEGSGEADGAEGAGGAEGAAGAEASAGETDFSGQTLTMAIPTVDGEIDAITAQIKAFEEKYGVTVDLEILPQGDEGENLKLVRIATGAMADVFMSAVGAKLTELSPAENMMDLSGQPFLENVDDGYLSIVTIDGAVYGVPICPSNVAGVFYNTKVYEELGLEVPETWDAFLENCQYIKENTEIAPVAAPNSQTSLSQIPFLTNYYYVQESNPTFAQDYTERKITLSECPEYVEGLQKMYDLAVNEHLNEDYLAATSEDVAMMLAEGTAAHSIIRSNILGTIAAVMPEQINDIGFFPLPDKDPAVRGVATWMPQAYLINKNAENPELALKFMEYITSEEAVEVYCSYQKPSGAFMLKGVELPDDVYPALAEAQSWVEKASTPVMEYFCSIKGSNQATICSQVASGQITPQEAVEVIEKDNEIDAQQKGLAGW